MRSKTAIFFIMMCVSLPVWAKNRIPELSQQPIRRFNPPPVSIFQLPNGFQLYLLENHQLPLFEAKLFIKVGDTYEPADLTGLADIVAALLVTGGSEKKKPLEVDEWLDSRAIHLTSDAGRELTNLGISCLSNGWKDALDFLAELLQAPGWDKDRFDLAIRNYKEDLRHDEDEPETISARGFRQAIYGEKHPWARVATQKSLDHIQIQDLKTFYQQFFGPNRMLLAVAGDFSPAAVKKWAEDWAGKLKPVTVEEANWQKLPFENKPGIKKIKKKVTQAFITAGHLGLERYSKDEYAYSLLQYILGGEPFTSRLGTDIRSDRGLAYEVYSDWDTNPVRGLFRINVQTRADAEEAVLERIQNHLERLASKADITEAELKLAKEALLNKYVFWFDSPFKTLFMRVKLDLLGFSPDYLQKYPDRIESVTLSDVQRVAREYIEPEGLKIIIVGP